MPPRIKHCRACSNRKLETIIDFGKIALTSVFPKNKRRRVPRWPLELVRCAGEGKAHCGLVQLAHRYPQKMIFGDEYGYRSGLNPVIENHLRAIARDIIRRRILKAGDVVLDVGSNDGTLLNAFRGTGLVRIGVDPTSGKFSKFYDRGIIRIKGFFSVRSVERALRGRKVKVLSTISIFYDMNEPLAFMKDAARLLDKEGLWVSEQSYLPSMLLSGAFDNICHEHVAYYGLRQMSHLASLAGLKVVHASLTSMNGGSIRVAFAHQDSKRRPAKKAIARILRMEEAMGLGRRQTYRKFAQGVSRAKERVSSFFASAKKGRSVVGYGASTKGNVLLQACGVTGKDLACIVDINPDKWGCFTPGSRIPILRESALARIKPTHLFVLPWHFQEYFLKKEKKFLKDGGALVFPFPKFRVVFAS